jgi:tetratricopeptide (TPR) repeat protein
MTLTPEPSSRVPLPLTTMLERVALAGGPAPAAETLRRAKVWKHLVQDYRPVAQSLEWQLSRLSWNREGINPFADNSVPYLVNNDGRLSADAAAVLFANCEEAGSADSPIRVLELGAGSGLFARYFLDEFRDLCRRGSRDFYHRLLYSVTDHSPRTIEQWHERGIFQEHAEHVAARTLDASAPDSAGPVRAVFCNYVLDSLPMAFVRKTAGGWQQLSVRTWITDDPAVLRQYTSRTLDEIRARAGSPDPEALEELLPVFPLLECEAEFLPTVEDAPPGLAELQDTGGGAPFAYNYGAIACLESLERVLERPGFVMINDYGPTQAEGPAGYLPGQRFGPAVAAVVNLPLLERHCLCRGLESWEPEGDAARRIHARLLSRGGLPRTRRAFEDRFAAAARDWTEALAQQTQQQAAAGLFRQALDSYRAAIECNPRNWQLIGQAAAFVTAQLRDPATGLELARSAIELNPWYSPYLWNVLGDCLSALERAREAHECYQQAERIRPADVETNLRLANSWLQLGDPARSLEAVARGLANDSNGMLRHVLLQRQQQAIDALTTRWHGERATAVRRRGNSGY